MKASNVLLSLWVLLVAGLVMVVVWFWRSDPGTGGAGDRPDVVLLDGKGGDKAGDGSKSRPKPGQPGRAGKPPSRQPQPPAIVAGIVKDGDGRPVEGATVRLHAPSKGPAAAAASTAADLEELRRIAQVVTVHEMEWEHVRALASWAEGPLPEGPRTSGPEVAATTTGADGRFSMELKPPMGRGPWRASARLDPLGSGSAANVYAGTDVELVLSTGGVVAGTVVGETDGAPVPDAKVVFDSGERLYGATSDAQGAFRVEGMPPGRYVVRAGAKDRTPILDQPVQVVRGEPVKLTLPRGTTLRVRTYFASADARRGAEPPVPNAEVVAYEDSAGVYVVGRSNAYGVAEFTGLPAGDWLVNARAAGYVTQGEVIVKLSANEPVHEDEIAFDEAVPTTVEVVDEAGLPVAGFEWYGSDADGRYDTLRSEKLPGETDRDGKWSFPFEFDGPRAAVYGFKKGYGVVRAAPLDYMAGETLKLVARKPIRVYGRVSDDKDGAVADAIVTFTIDPQDAEIADPLTVRVRTNAQGAYEFTLVPLQADVTVEAETEDAWSDDLPTVEVEPGKTDYQIDLRIESTATVHEVQVGKPDPGAPKPPARREDEVPEETPQPPR